jgi:hypothetical protein
MITEEKPHPITNPAAASRKDGNAGRYGVPAQVTAADPDTC